MKHKVMSILLYLPAIGLAAFALVLPFVGAARGGQVAPESAGAGQTPLLSLLLVGLCLLALLVEIQGQVANAKTIALLGVLVALTATLRFVEVAIPGPGGFSPVFVPIILGGYVFGARFGFLLGAMTLLVSAIITAGIGPWLPYQMFTAGWMGMTAGWLPHPQRPGAELGLLLGFGFLWGFLFGGIMNLYSWPYIVGNAQQSWQPGSGLSQALSRYGAFYVATSLLWDLAAAVGNVILLLILGLPSIRALSRFRDRYQFQVAGV